MPIQLELRQEGTKTYLMGKNGTDNVWCYLLGVNAEGTFELMPSVFSHLGFQLDGYLNIVVKHSNGNTLN